MAWKRIVGWVRDSSDFGARPGNELPEYAGPVDPGYGVSEKPNYPSTGPIKPPGLPILPPHADNGLPPNGHPWGPGNWVPVDPGFGKPPIFGFKPIDPGFGVGVGGKPDNSLPGHWVPVDPGYDIPCEGKIKPIWLWIAEIGPGFGIDNTLPSGQPPTINNTLPETPAPK